MEKTTATAYATQAMSDKYTGIPYNKLDCQAFVEQVLKDCNVRKPDGTAYNWRGSNDMWRNALSWKGTIQEAITRFGSIPVGSWAFIVKNDGGEKERGYHDNEGNAAHVGIYCREQYDPIRDSTRTSYRDGVGYRELSGFTHIGLPFMIDYESSPETPMDALTAVSTLRDENSTDAQILEALKILTKYLKGC